MEFVKNCTPSDFQEKFFTPSISPNFNGFSKKKHKKWVNMEKFTPLAKILHCRRQCGIDKFHLWWRIIIEDIWYLKYLLFVNLHNEKITMRIFDTWNIWNIQIVWNICHFQSVCQSCTMRKSQKMLWGQFFISGGCCIYFFWQLRCCF